MGNNVRTFLSVFHDYMRLNLEISFLVSFSWVTLWVSLALYLTCIHCDIKVLFHADD